MCSEHFRTLLNLQLALHSMSQAGHSKPNEHVKKLSQARQRPTYIPRSAPPWVCQGIIYYYGVKCIS